MKKLISTLAILLIGTATINAQVWETLPSKKLTEVNTLLLSKGYAKVYGDDDLNIYTKASSLINYKVTVMFSPKTKIVNGITLYENSYSTFNSAENRYNEIKKALSEKHQLLNEKYEFFSPYNEDDVPAYKYDAVTSDKSEIYTLFSYNNEKYINLSIDYDVRSSRIAVLLTYLDMTQRDLYEKEKAEQIKTQY